MRFIGRGKISAAEFEHATSGHNKKHGKEAIIK